MPKVTLCEQPRQEILIFLGFRTKQDTNLLNKRVRQNIRWSSNNPSKSTASFEMAQPLK
jgi:hypothetical protein